MAKKSQNGTLDCDYFIFLAHFAFPIVKHWHILKTAILTVVDMTILRYEERIVRLARKEREKFRALDAPFRNQLNRVIPLWKRRAESVIYKRARATETDKKTNEITII